MKFFGYKSFTNLTSNELLLKHITTMDAIFCFLGLTSNIAINIVSGPKNQCSRDVGNSLYKSIYFILK
jgi:hypothetical protein